LSVADGKRSDAVRQLAGFLIAVFGTAFLFTVGAGALFVILDGPGPSPSVILGTLILVFAASAAVIGAAAIVVGLPLTWILAANRMENDWVYPLSGLVAGAAVPIILSGWLGVAGRDLETLPYLILACAAPGALCGWLWWKFGRGKILRRDREATKP